MAHHCLRWSPHSFTRLINSLIIAPFSFLSLVSRLSCYRHFLIYPKEFLGFSETACSLVPLYFENSASRGNNLFQSRAATSLSCIWDMILHPSTQFFWACPDWWWRVPLWEKKHKGKDTSATLKNPMQDLVSWELALCQPFQPRGQWAAGTMHAVTMLPLSPSLPGLRLVSISDFYLSFDPWSSSSYLILSPLGDLRKAMSPFIVRWDSSHHTAHPWTQG